MPNYTHFIAHYLMTFKILSENAYTTTEYKDIIHFEHTVSMN